MWYLWAAAQSGLMVFWSLFHCLGHHEACFEMEPQSFWRAEPLIRVLLVACNRQVTCIRSEFWL